MNTDQILTPQKRMKKILSARQGTPEKIYKTQKKKKDDSLISPKKQKESPTR